MYNAVIYYEKKKQNTCNTCHVYYYDCTANIPAILD
jgi:hypothetical protein